MRSGLLYQMPNMAERAMELVERHRPDVLVLLLGANVFAEETAAFSLRRRFPALYGPAMRAIALVKRGAGGGMEGSRSSRGALFRVPRDLARRVVGTAPLTEPESATEATVRLFEALDTRPDLAVVCRLTIGNYQDRAQATRARERASRYNAVMKVECAKRGYPWLDLLEEFAAAGREYALTPDGLHADFATRRQVAYFLADRVLDVLDRE